MRVWCMQWGRKKCALLAGERRLLTTAGPEVFSSFQTDVQYRSRCVRACSGNGRELLDKETPPCRRGLLNNESRQVEIKNTLKIQRPICAHADTIWRLLCYFYISAFADKCLSASDWEKYTDLGNFSPQWTDEKIFCCTSS